MPGRVLEWAPNRHVALLVEGDLVLMTEREAALYLLLVHGEVDWETADRLLFDGISNVDYPRQAIRNLVCDLRERPQAHGLNGQALVRFEGGRLWLERPAEEVP